jgi:hypothetical protein
MNSVKIAYDELSNEQIILHLLYASQKQLNDDVKALLRTAAERIEFGDPTVNLDVDYTERDAYGRAYVITNKLEYR